MSDTRIAVILTTEEKREIQERAAQAGMSESEYGYWRIFGRPGGELSPMHIAHAQCNLGYANSCLRRMEDRLNESTDIPEAVKTAWMDEFTQMVEHLRLASGILMPPESEYAQQILERINAAEAR